VSQKNPPWTFLKFFPNRWKFLVQILQAYYTLPIYAQLQIFIQLPATLMKLCHIKLKHPVHIICPKCPPSAETHTGIFWHFPQSGIFSPNFTHLLHIPIYVRLQIFIQLPPTVMKLCHIKCDHPACVLANGGHFGHMMVVALTMV